MSFADVTSMVQNAYDRVEQTTAEFERQGLLNTQQGPKTVTQTQQGYGLGYMSCCASTVLVLAMLIIGSVAASGGMSPIAAGATGIALAVPLVGLKLCSTWSEPNKGLSLVKKIAHVVAGLAVVTLGALTIAGLLPTVAVGATMAGVAALWMLSSCGSSLAGLSKLVGDSDGQSWMARLQRWAEQENADAA